MTHHPGVVARGEALRGIRALRYLRFIEKELATIPGLWVSFDFDRARSRARRGGTIYAPLEVRQPGRPAVDHVFEGDR